MDIPETNTKSSSREIAPEPHDSIVPRENVWTNEALEATQRLLHHSEQQGNATGIKQGSNLQYDNAIVPSYSLAQNSLPPLGLNNLGVRPASDYSRLADELRHLHHDDQPFPPDKNPDPRRVDLAHEFSQQALTQFDKLNTITTGFLSKRELLDAKTSAFPELTLNSADYLAMNHDFVKNLWDDDKYHASGGVRASGSGSWERDNKLGISRNDLKFLKAATSSDPADLLAGAKQFGLKGPEFQIGSVLGFTVAGSCGIMSAAGLASRSTGWIGLGVGLGLVAGGYALSVRNRYNEMETLRDKVAHDRSLDAYLRKK